MGADSPALSRTGGLGTNSKEGSKHNNSRISSSSRSRAIPGVKGFMRKGRPKLWTTKVLQCPQTSSMTQSPFHLLHWGPALVGELSAPASVLVLPALALVGVHLVPASASSAASREGRTRRSQVSACSSSRASRKL